MQQEALVQQAILDFVHFGANHVKEQEELEAQALQKEQEAQTPQEEHIEYPLCITGKAYVFKMASQAHSDPGKRVQQWEA